MHCAEIVGHHFQLRRGSKIAGVQNTTSHCCQNRQDKFERSARATGKNCDIASIGAVTAAGDRAFHKHGAARLDQGPKPDDFTIIGGAHFKPYLPLAHDLQKAIFAFGNSRTGGRRRKAGDDKIYSLSQFFWRGGRRCTARHIFCNKRII